MKVGDLVTHEPTGSVGIIIEETERSICVVWCHDPVHNDEGQEEWLSKVFVDHVKSDKK